MTKNDLIEELSKIEGNPEIVTLDLNSDENNAVAVNAKGVFEVKGVQDGDNNETQLLAILY